MKKIIIAVLMMVSVAGAESIGIDNTGATGTTMIGNKIIDAGVDVKGGIGPKAERPSIIQVQHQIKSYGKDTLDLSIGFIHGKPDRLVGIKIMRNGKNEFTWEE